MTPGDRLDLIDGAPQVDPEHGYGSAADVPDLVLNGTPPDDGRFCKAQRPSPFLGRTGGPVLGAWRRPWW